MVRFAQPSPTHGGSPLGVHTADDNTPPLRQSISACADTAVWMSLIGYDLFAPSIFKSASPAATSSD